ncbi:Os02g0488400 [Oryza sativa Japonica Group]|uniref:Os02g0488400 protein n=1 Tax=Oryza sativa subsp. japonica TaxID=39947 RepID=A0A0P0VJ88_ORYSJ|nr:Os02g0488400 [Oryza sativa Japonica Group]
MGAHDVSAGTMTAPTLSSIYGLCIALFRHTPTLADGGTGVKCEQQRAAGSSLTVASSGEQAGGSWGVNTTAASGGVINGGKRWGADPRRRWQECRRRLDGSKQRGAAESATTVTA